MISALGLLVSLATAQSAQHPPLPPPPEVEYALPHYKPVPLQASSEPAASGPEDLLLSVVDDQTLRAEITVMHTENQQVALGRIKAWQAGSDLRIVIPADYVESPYGPVCCIQFVRLDLLLSTPQGLPEKVTVSLDFSNPKVRFEQPLVPQR